MNYYKSLDIIFNSYLYQIQQLIHKNHKNQEQESFDTTPISTQLSIIEYDVKIH